MVVAPAGAGKTFGVAGWVQHDNSAVASGWTADQQTGPALDRHLAAPATGRPPASSSSTTPTTPRPQCAPDAASARPGPTPAPPADPLGPRDQPSRARAARPPDGAPRRHPEAQRRRDGTAGRRARAHRLGGHCQAIRPGRGMVRSGRARRARRGRGAKPRRFIRRCQEAGPGVADLVAGEVFAALRSRERHLLLCTAAEPVLTGETARHLTRDPSAGDVLATLESTGLLVIRVADSEPDDEDSTRVRFRIHPLLLEVARRRLIAGGVDVQQAHGTVLRAAASTLPAATPPTASAVSSPWASTTRPPLCSPSTDHGWWATATPTSTRSCGRPTRWSTRTPRPGRPSPGRVDSPETRTAPSTGWTGCSAWRPRPPVAHRSRSRRSVCRRRGAAWGGRETRSWRARTVLDPEQPLPVRDSFLSVLLLELGVAENWLGDLDEAEQHLSEAVLLSRAERLESTTVEALDAPGPDPVHVGSRECLPRPRPGGRHRARAGDHGPARHDRAGSAGPAPSSPARVAVAATRAAAVRAPAPARRPGRPVLAPAPRLEEAAVRGRRRGRAAPPRAALRAPRAARPPAGQPADGPGRPGADHREPTGVACDGPAAPRPRRGRRAAVDRSGPRRPGRRPPGCRRGLRRGERVGMPRPTCNAGAEPGLRGAALRLPRRAARAAAPCSDRP